jgi:outer membrane protein
MQQNIQTFQETASQDLQKKRAELLRPLYEKAVAAIDKISKSLGFDYVLDTTQGLGVLVSNGTDISAEVKVELGF